MPLQGCQQKLCPKSSFFDPIRALSIPGVEEQSKHLRKAENQLKVTTVPDFGFGSSLKACQSFKSHQKFLKIFTPSSDAICALSVARSAWHVRCSVCV
jgi:hypothetical protein